MQLRESWSTGHGWENLFELIRYSGLYVLRVDRPRHDDKTGPVFDIQLVRRGLLPKVLKRVKLMDREARKEHEKRYPGIYEYKRQRCTKRPNPKTNPNPLSRIRYCHPAFWALGRNI